METKNSTITKEQLLENGWIEKDDPVFPISKNISDIHSEDYDPENKLEMVVHRMYNVNMFALSIPDGYLININPTSIEDLIFFEKMILSVDPPY